MRYLSPTALFALLVCCSPQPEPTSSDGGASETGTAPDSGSDVDPTVNDTGGDVAAVDIGPDTSPDSSLDTGRSDAAGDAGPTCTTDEECLRDLPECDIADVERDPGGGWKDSYSVGDKCYCDSGFDHGIGEVIVDTPVGEKTVREVCDALGPGPGSDGHPVYNDIQCGNGPANDAGDEDWCPGRVDQGQDGCCTAGPTWDFSDADW